jgi:hypothetical protein
MFIDRFTSLARMVRNARPQLPGFAWSGLGSLNVLLCVMAGAVLVSTALFANSADSKRAAREYVMAPAAPKAQSQAQADAKSAGCVSCHTATDRHTMHANPGVVIGCADCHGGNAAIKLPQNVKPADPAYRQALDAAHIAPRDEKFWNYPSSANPERQAEPGASSLYSLHQSG